MKKVGTKTAKQFISDVQDELNVIGVDNITPKRIMKALNEAKAEFHEIAGEKDLEDYRETTEIALAASKGVIIGSTSDFNGSTKILTIAMNSELWINCSPGFNNDFLGAFVTLFDTTGSVSLGIVEAIVDSTHAKLKINAGGVSDGEIAGSVVVGSLGTFIDIGSYSIYNNIDVIDFIEDSINGPWVKKAPKIASGIQKPGSENDNYTDSILWSREGDRINLKKGSGVTSIGTITIHWVRKTYDCVTGSDLVDIQNSNIRHLKTIVKHEIVASTEGVKMPQSLSSAYELLMRAKQAQVQEQAVVDKKQ